MSAGCWELVYFWLDLRVFIHLFHYYECSVNLQAMYIGVQPFITLGIVIFHSQIFCVFLFCLEFASGLRLRNVDMQSRMSSPKNSSRLLKLSCVWIVIQTADTYSCDYQVTIDIFFYFQRLWMSIAKLAIFIQYFCGRGLEKGATIRLASIVIGNSRSGLFHS